MCSPVVTHVYSPVAHGNSLFNKVNFTKICLEVQEINLMLRLLDKLRPGSLLVFFLDTRKGRELQQEEQRQATDIYEWPL
ncbi:hypothetical protein D3C72_1996480 [compost metagenome]